MGEDRAARKPKCTQTKGNRRIQVSFELRRYRQQAKENLLSEQGIALRQLCNTQPETVFGDIKHNMDFRGFMLRGLKNRKFDGVNNSYANVSIALDSTIR